MILAWWWHAYRRSGRKVPAFSVWPGLIALALLWMALLTACAGSGPSFQGPGISVTGGITEPQGKAPTAILRVPEDYPTIQAAVNAAKPYALISIAPGIYHEFVTVRTAHLTIRGRDRNGVILDGNFKLTNGFEVLADNVVLENMTARHFQANGFYWMGVKGFRASYLTAYANGDYGVYAYGSNTGQFDHDLAEGQPDSGFYIGYCHPCNAIITNVISEDNALGYSGTNAGGNLVIRDSIWRNNIAGIVPNTLDSEPKAPQAGATIINNLVENNNNYSVPTGPSEYPAGGSGIV